MRRCAIMASALHNTPITRPGCSIDREERRRPCIVAVRTYREGESAMLEFLIVAILLLTLFSVCAIRRAEEDISDL
jgi:hypothetical protein